MIIVACSGKRINTGHHSYNFINMPTFPTTEVE